MYIIYNTARSSLHPLQCGPGRDGHKRVLKDVDTYISVCLLFPSEDCFFYKHHSENSKPLISIFSYEKLFIWIQEHFLELLNFLITTNVLPFRQTDCLNFMNISKVFKLKSCETMRLFWGGVRGEKMPFYGVFHVFIYISTYLKAISPLIYIQRDKAL